MSAGSMMSLGWLLLLAQPSATLSIETDSPDALCPPVTATREAVAARLGALDAPSGWTARYTIGHAPDQSSGDFVRLQVFDPSGRLRMERTLPMQNGSCAEMAPAIALLLDYFFRNLANPDASPSDAADRGDGPGAAPATATARTDAAVAAATNRAGTAAAAKARTDAVVPAAMGRASTASAAKDRLNIAIEGKPGTVAEKAPLTDASRASTGPASRNSEAKTGSLALPGHEGQWWLGTGLGQATMTTAPTLWLEGSRVFGTLAGGLDLSLPLGRERESLGESRVLMWSAALRGYVGPIARSERFTARAGLELLLGVDHATPYGLRHESTQWRMVPGIGLSGGAVFWILSRLGISIVGGIDWTPTRLTNQFLVWTNDLAGKAEVHRPPVGRGFVGLGVTFRTNP